MDPEACLKRIATALDALDLDEAGRGLSDYAAWRAGGGFEPKDGDARADALSERADRIVADDPRLFYVPHA